MYKSDFKEFGVLTFKNAKLKNTGRPQKTAFLYAKAIPDSTLRTAVSGCISRWQFEVAKKMIMDSIKNKIDKL